MSIIREHIYLFKKIIIFRKYKNNHEKLISLTGFKFFIIINILIKILSNNRNIISKFDYSEIKLKIKGPGMKNIFGQEHFVNIYYPNIIYINGEIQNSIQRAYNFNQSINYVVLIWNNYLTYCGGMFYGSSDIIEFDFSEFNTSKVEYMGFMFCNCSSLISLNISNFDTSNVMSFRYMFSGCILLTSLNLSNFNTTKLNLMYNMFDGCVNLKYINMKNFNDINLSEYNNIFNKVPENVVLCVNISNVRNKIFNQIKNLKCHNIECSDDWFLYQKRLLIQLILNVNAN